MKDKTLRYTPEGEKLANKEKWMRKGDKKKVKKSKQYKRDTQASYWN